MSDTAERPDPMGTRFAETDTDRLIAETLASDGDEFVERLRAIHHRCTEEIFLKAVLLVRETYPRRQALGFDILAGLGGGTSRPFAATTAPILLDFLAAEENELVLASVINAFGQLWGHSDGATFVPGLEHVQRYAGHESSAIRYAVTVALGSMSTPDDERVSAFRAAELADLALDEDREIRDIAVFYLELMAQIEGYRGLVLIDALRRLSKNADIEIRQQAIAGLAYAGAFGATELVEAELEASLDADTYVLDIVDAAASLADPSLLPALEALKADRPLPAHFLARFDAAIAACSNTRDQNPARQQGVG